jgi:hypothetical protein
MGSSVLLDVSGHIKCQDTCMLTCNCRKWNLRPEGGCPVSWPTIHLLACHQPDLISLLRCHLLKYLTGTGRDWCILEPLTWGCESSMVHTKMRHHSNAPPIRDHHVSGL